MKPEERQTNWAPVRILPLMRDETSRATIAQKAGVVSSIACGMRSFASTMQLLQYSPRESKGRALRPNLKRH